MKNKKLIYQDIQISIYISDTEPFPSDSELNTIIADVKAKAKAPIEKIELMFEKDYVDVTYHLQPVPFERIRRITGYLVGDMARFNDAKVAEVRDRKKHSLADTMRLRDTDGDGRNDYIDSDGYTKPSMKYKQVTADEFEILSKRDPNYVKEFSRTEDGDFILRLSDSQKVEIDNILKQHKPPMKIK